MTTTYLHKVKITLTNESSFKEITVTLDKSTRESDFSGPVLLDGIFKKYHSDAILKLGNTIIHTSRIASLTIETTEV